MSEALAKVEDPPRTQGAIVLREALREATEQRALLKEYVDRHMVEGTDYGKIPGTDKPTLLKPGAEKLVDLFRCTPKFALVTREENFEGGFFNYIFRVRLFSRDAEAVLAEGFGSANSREGRYRWRNASRKCPTCGKESIIAGKPEYGGGWLCFRKRGGCGAKFSENDKAITGQAQGKVENDDIATMANTILKMAKKRALVDGAIALARCSDLFTQDTEDLPPEHRQDGPPPPEDDREPPPPAPPPEQSKPKRADPKTEIVPAKPPGPPCEHEYELRSGICGKCGAKENRGPQQSPSLRARVSKVWNAVKASGKDAPYFQAWAGRVLGKSVPSAEWTEDDVAHVEAALPELLGAAPESAGEAAP